MAPSNSVDEQQVTPQRWLAGDLIVPTPAGLYCPQGDFYIDPMRPVGHAVITHAHADHARGGHQHYLCAAEGAAVLRQRLPRIQLQTLPYGQVVNHRGVRLSLHPAGHVLGSAQVRLEHAGQVWVVSGDYHLSEAGDHNPTCAPFEPVRCHCFITESTFALPVYRWAPQAHTFAAMARWCAANAAEGLASVVQGYSLGKAQHLLAGLGAVCADQPLWVHDTVADMNQAYAVSGVALPQARRLSQAEGAEALRGAIVISPPQATNAALRAVPQAVAFASGWMQLKRGRQQRGLGSGFVLSDHADWPGLLAAVAATRAERVIAMHGFADVLARWLQEHGLQAGRLGHNSRPF